MIVIAGLGNPGREYEHTRHNCGFDTIDVIADRQGSCVARKEHRALTGAGYIGGQKVLLVKPQTYMNLSGDAVRPLVEFFKIQPDHLILVYDDVDLPLGRTRVRASGSAGTHNGMRSVIYQLQFDNFPRVRIGLGPHGDIPLDKFVIGNWTELERPELAKAVLRAADACETIVREGIDAAMQKYNGL